MKDKIYFYDEDNVQKEGILLMNIKYKNNDYIIYTDNHKNEKNELRILASKVETKNNELHLLEITAEDEWDYIEKVITKLREK